MVIGKYVPATDTEPEKITREYFEQGDIFKDYEAYESDLEKPCYIPELFDSVYTHRDFLNICNNQEEIARELFDSVNWQSPETLFNEWDDQCELDACEECGKLFFCYEVESCPHCHAQYKFQEV